MKIFGIVAEYNPFHNGHERQIVQARELGATHIVVVMSSNFVQRGEPSIANKFIRARAAIESGVDLVIELPTPYVLSSAERFGYGAIYILESLGVVDCLIFGMETDKKEELETIVEVIETKDFGKKVRKLLKEGISYPKSRQIALEVFLGKDLSKNVTGPNNILGIEYIKWLKRFGSQIKILPIKREGVMHDKNETIRKQTSAKNLRDMIKVNNEIELWQNYVPEVAFEIYKDASEKRWLPIIEKTGERAILSQLRQLDLYKIREVLDVSEGLENRIYQSIKKSRTLKELYENIKTKRYTMSRIRRIIYNIFLNIGAKDLKFAPQYVRVIASNNRGLEIIKEIKRNERSRICIDNNLKRLSKLNDISKRQVDLEIKATDMYGLFYDEVLLCEEELRHKFDILT